MRNYFADYPQNSRSAILRAAILVSLADGRWHRLERDKLEGVYRDVCRMLDADLDNELMLKELDTIITDVPNEVRSFHSDEEREEYWNECMAPIVSRDIQEVAVMAAHRISSGDGEIQPKEASGLSRLCEAWDVNLGDALDHCRG